MQPLAAVLLALAADGGVALLDEPPRDAGCAEYQVPYAGKCMAKKRFVVLLSTLEGWRDGCARDDPKGCAPLGEAYRDGTLVPQSFDYAAKLFRRGCDLGEPLACGLLAEAHRKGNGVPKDLEKRAGLLARACEKSDGASCQQLGSAYSTGEGVKPDAKKARALYGQACALGLTLGCETAQALDASKTR